MGNSLIRLVNSASPGLGLSFTIFVNKYLPCFSKSKSIFIPKNSPPATAGLAVIFHETIPFNSNSDSIVFPPPVIALDLLYSAPAELWNWNHPRSPDFRVANRSISARDFILLPISAFDVICWEEYTSVVSTKDGYPKMTHLYGDILVDCHPIPRSMLPEAEADGNHSDDISNEFFKRCCICSKTNTQMSEDVSMHKDEAFCKKELDDKESAGGKK